MKKIVLFICVCFFTLALFAQNFSASVSKNPVEVGEQFQLTFSLNNSGSGFKAPAMPDFSVLSGPNQSSSMQFVNGSMSQSISYSYYLSANKTGKFKIEGASIECNGKRISANALTVEVVKGNGSAKSQQQGGQQQQGGANEQLSKSVFLKATANKTNPYVGEEVTVTYKLYTKVNLTNYSITKLPAMNGFWSQEIEMPKNAQQKQTRETINGVQFLVVEIKKMILFPQRSGNLELDPMEGECIARVQAQRQRSNDPFAQFFNDPFFGYGQQDVKVEMKSEPIKINVRALPGTEPESFTGAVGKMSMEAFIDKPETKTNDPVTLKIKISGAGNLKLVDAPKTVFPPDIETYDPKNSDNISVSINGVSGSRTFEYLLVPRHAGEYKIAPIQFSYFNLEKKTFETISSKEFILKVAKGSETESAVNVSGVSKEDLKFLGKDIRYIKTGKAHWKKEGEFFFGSWLHYSLLFSPALLLSVFVVVYRRNKEMQSNLSLMKSRKATKVAKKRLAVAKVCLEKNEKEKYYDEIFKALWGYLGDKLGIPVSNLSKETAEEHLKAKGIGESEIKKIIGTIDRCEFARFAPGGSAEMQSMYNETITLISTMEQEIKA